MNDCPDCGTRCDDCGERMCDYYGPEPAVTCGAHVLCVDCSDSNNPCAECAYWKAAMAS